MLHIGKFRNLVAKLRDWWFSKQTLSKTWWLFMIIWSRIRGTQKRNFGTKLSQKCLPDIARSSSSDIIYLSVPDRRPGSDFPMCAHRLISIKYIPQSSCAKIGLSLEPMGQLHPNLNWRLLLSIDFTTRSKLNFKGQKGQKRPGFRPLRPCGGI